jgi:tRNA threonylcarbamoyladenosine biosynthesis protein TsaB
MSSAPRLLCLDTSTPTARVAVVAGGDARARAEATADRHSAHVLKLVDEVLRAAGLAPGDVDALVCGAGPGSFTGLRVGLAVVKGLALATGKPLLLVSSLYALALDLAAALPAGEARVIVPCIDAGKGEVYAAAYATGGADLVAEVGEPWRLRPEALAERLVGRDGAVVGGNGADRHAALLDGALPRTARRVPVAGPTATALARLAAPRFARGEADDLEKAVPFYGRPPDITKPKRPA